MDPVGARFYQANFELECGGREISLRGLFSGIGVTRIVVPGGLPEFWRGRLGKLVIVKLDTLQLNGILLEQVIESGSFFEIRFRGISDTHRKYLQQRILADGISPGWRREFPRIPVEKVPDPELPVPNLCMVRFQDQEVFVSVMNFTLRGVRIETLGDQLKELRAGSEFDFDLLTSTGVILANLRAEIRNLTSHEASVGGHKVLTRSFGIRFVSMSAENELKYRSLIRDYCLALQKRLDAI